MVQNSEIFARMNGKCLLKIEFILLFDKIKNDYINKFMIIEI